MTSKNIKTNGKNTNYNINNNNNIHVIVISSIISITIIRKKIMKLHTANTLSYVYRFLRMLFLAYSRSIHSVPVAFVYICITITDLYSHNH